jgi:Secretion system C-terminal sorting domain
MKKLHYVFVCLVLLSFNVLAQQNVSQFDGNVIQTIENGVTVYKRVPKGNSVLKEQDKNISNPNFDAPNNINAGPYLASEGFEDPFFPPTDWEIFSFDIDWEQTDIEFNSGSNSAVIFGDIFIESWLITPEIDLTTATGPKLQYYEYVELDQGLEGQHDVLISTDYDGTDTPDLFNWTVIRTGIVDIFSWDLREIDLSSYIGETVYIAFQYTGVQEDVGDFGSSWYIDDVIVDDLCTGTEPVPNCAALNSPPDGATLYPNFISFWWNTPVNDVTLVDLSVWKIVNGSPVYFYQGEFDPNTIGVGPFTNLLDNNTTYYWQVIPKNCSKTALNCPVWSFTTNNGEYNFGGGDPSQGGYFWANTTPGASGAPTQPVFNWRDISVSGTDVIGSISDDQTIGPFNIGFTFNYFGIDYTQFYINSNGFITFSSTAISATFGPQLPNEILPNNIIAGYWKDLDPSNTNVTGQHLYYGNDNGDMVITFEHYPEISGDVNGWITFQIILTSTGNIKVQFQNAGTSFDINSGTVGIENSNGTEGITYRYRSKGAPIFGSPLALEFGSNSGALPVELTSFSASVNDGNVNLNWETATEVNNFGFEILRFTSKDGRSEPDLSGEESFEKIGFVEGHGNSNSSKQYFYSDNAVVSGKSYYRLKQIDNDGTFEYSDVVEVELGMPGEFSLSQNYPNPFNPSTKIKYEIPGQARNDNMLVTLKVYDVLGNEVATLVNEEKTAGTYEVDFDASQFTSGVYIYRLQTGEFRQTRKMILMR